jgi:RNA polymerase sigma-70 factor (ECF subfamily)
LGYFEGLSSSEIAARLALPVGTVKSRVAAALTKLRSALAEGPA